MKALDILPFICAQPALRLAPVFKRAAALSLAAGIMLMAGAAAARDGMPRVPEPPASARTIPDPCLGTSCPKKVDPGRTQPPCLGTSCPGSGYSGPGPGSGANRSTGAAPAPWSGPAQPKLPPMPSRPGQPIGPMTPAPALPR